MANDVSTELVINFTDESLLNKFLDENLNYNNIISNEEKTYHERITDLGIDYLAKLVPTTLKTSSDFIEHFGSKWIFFDSISYEDSTLFIYLESAYSAPLKMFKTMYEDLKDIDPDVTMEAQWSDEYYNFIGAGYYCPIGFEWDEYEPTSDELNMFEAWDEEFYTIMEERFAELLQSSKNILA